MTLQLPPVGVSPWTTQNRSHSSSAAMSAQVRHQSLTSVLPKVSHWQSPSQWPSSTASSSCLEYVHSSSRDLPLSSSSGNVTKKTKAWPELQNSNDVHTVNHQFSPKSFSGPIQRCEHTDSPYGRSHESQCHSFLPAQPRYIRYTITRLCRMLAVTWFTVEVRFSSQYVPALHSITMSSDWKIDIFHLEERDRRSH